LRSYACCGAFLLELTAVRDSRVTLQDAHNCAARGWLLRFWRMQEHILPAFKTLALVAQPRHRCWRFALYLLSSHAFLRSFI
jgi:hypothetical protein